VPDLQTRRLLLHPVTLEEGEALHRGGSLAGWTCAPGYPLPDTRDGVGFLLRHRVEDFGFYLAVRRSDGLVVGEIGFTGPPTAGVVTIGYAIVPSARRQGYASEAIAALSTWALAQPGVEEVRAQTLPDNAGSVRALLRAGFVESEADDRARRFSRRAG
jgi:RimJ/RimL family protein N-acetyltransferase